MSKLLIDMGYSGLRKVISGGQVGVDRGALDAAKEWSLSTGGCAPLGYRTTNGIDLSLKGYGLIEHTSPLYPPRTRQNVLDSDGTLIIASDTTSAGTVLTARYCHQLSKPMFVIAVRKGDIKPICAAAAGWIIKNEIEVLNVAGNHRSPEYHEQVTRTYLMSIFYNLREVGKIR